MRLHWKDDETGARGYLVVDTLVGGLATGGTRMRAGCTLREVEDLARGMTRKTAAFDLPIGGAKGG
ncbi:glutamate dehydrogenase, partial [Dietzia sp. SLG510A3-40A3]|nr:glutamate dehydrogenase [Dietzia sp. SLG510A3-40A3]